MCSSLENNIYWSPADTWFFLIDFQNFPEFSTFFFSNFRFSQFFSPQLFFLFENRKIMVHFSQTYARIWNFGQILDKGWRLLNECIYYDIDVGGTYINFFLVLSSIFFFNFLFHNKFFSSIVSFFFFFQVFAPKFFIFFLREKKNQKYVHLFFDILYIL